MNILNSKSKYGCKPKDKIDTIDLEIIQCLSRDCRASYRDISSVVGITPNAIKGRINKMVCNGIIQWSVNPGLFGYEKRMSFNCKAFLHKNDKNN